VRRKRFLSERSPNRCPKVEGTKEAPCAPRLSFVLATAEQERAQPSIGSRSRFIVNSMFDDCRLRQLSTSV